jgi:hypothetical protein
MGKSKVSDAHPTKKDMKAFKASMEASILRWKQGMKSSESADIGDLDDSLWDSEDIVMFPNTLRYRSR